MKTVLCMCVLDGLFIGLSGKSALAYLSSKLGNVTEDTLYNSIKDNNEFKDVELTISTPFEYFENMLVRLDAGAFVKDAKEFYDYANEEEKDDWPYMVEMTTSTGGYIFVVMFDDEMM